MSFNPDLPGLAVTRSDTDDGVRMVRGPWRPDETAVDTLKAAGWRFHGYRWLNACDIPHGNQPVRVRVGMPRYRRLHPEKGLLQLRPDFLDPLHRLTRRATDFIRHEWPRSPANVIATKVGCSPKTVMRIVQADQALFEAAFTPSAPVRLGIDECHIGGRARGVLCDLDTVRLVDLTPGHGRADILSALRTLAHPERVAVVAVDFTPRYISAAREILGPDVPVVIDRWHVEKQARDAFYTALRTWEKTEQSRGLRPLLRLDRSVMKKPEHQLSDTERAIVAVIVRQDPTIAAGWRACQDFCALFNLSDRIMAEQRYDTWAKNLPHPVRSMFSKLIRLVKKYREEIFAYIALDTTNNPTENLNRRLGKLAALGGQKLDFPAFRHRAHRALGAADPTARQGAAAAPKSPAPPGGRGKRGARRRKSSGVRDAARPLPFQQLQLL